MELPGAVGNSAAYVAVKARECRQCGEVSPWYTTDDTSNGISDSQKGESDMFEWTDAHNRTTGHTAFWTVTVARSQARFFRV